MIEHWSPLVTTGHLFSAALPPLQVLTELSFSLFLQPIARVGLYCVHSAPIHHYQHIHTCLPLNFLKGLFQAPGFYDSHVSIKASYCLLTLTKPIPRNFDKLRESPVVFVGRTISRHGHIAATLSRADQSHTTSLCDPNGSVFRIASTA